MILTKGHKKQLERIRRYQTVFSSPDGKWVLDDLIKVHHILGPLPDRHPGEIHRAEGERNAILRIMSILNMDPVKLEERMKTIARGDDYTEE